MQKAFYTQQIFYSVSEVWEDIIYKHLHMRTIEYKKYKKFMDEKMQWNSQRQISQILGTKSELDCLLWTLINPRSP